MTGGENQENRKNEGNFFGIFFKCGAMMLDSWEKNTLLNNFLDKTPFAWEKNTLFGNSLGTSCHSLFRSKEGDLSYSFSMN
jgi:hypothetical protein